MRSLGVLSLLALTLIAGGCLHDEKTTTVTVRETVTEPGTGTVPGADVPTALTLFFLRDGKVEPVSSLVVTGTAVARAAVTELLKGPAVVEEEPGLAPETAIPEGTELGGISVADGVAHVEFSRAMSREAQAQVVYTLTEFPMVKRVRFLVGGEPQGPPRGRAAYEAQTPAVLVLSPLPGEGVEPGFASTGTANTFEATFNYELRNESGRVIAKNFVTATSGSGTRGTFRFTVPYEVDRPQGGSLVVFEISAADGSRINEISIPLRLE